MLGVTFTSLAALGEGETRKKGKKDKKKKKEKRSQKEKREKRAASNSSGDSGCDDVGPGEESPDKLPDDDQAATRKQQGTEDKVAAEAVPALQREDWMTRPMKRESSKVAPEDEEREQEEAKQAAEPEIESGLRMMKKPNTATGAPGADLAPAAGAKLVAETASRAVPASRGGLVGDGGASWRLKALRRAQEQARAEGRSLDQVVGERWGSLAELTEGLTSTVAADGKAHLRIAAQRRKAAMDSPPPLVPHYLQDVRSEQAKMMRPAEDASLRWCRDRGHDQERASGRGKDRPVSYEGGRDGDDGISEPSSRDRHDRASNRAGDGPHVEEGSTRERRPEECSRREEERETHGSHQNHPDHSLSTRGDRDPQEADRSRGGEDRVKLVSQEQPQDLQRDSGREGDRQRNSGRERDRQQGSGRERDRQQGSGRERDRQQDSGRERDRQQDSGRERDGDCDGGRESRAGWTREREPSGRGREVARGGDPRGGGSRPSREQAAALKLLAGSLNSFNDDGSFMARFLTLQQGRHQQSVEEAEERAMKSEPSASGSDLQDCRPRGGTSGEGSRLKSDVGGDEVAPRAAAGPESARASGPAGTGNRGVAVMLRARAASGGTAETVASDRGPDPGGEDVERTPDTAPPRRAPLVVGRGGGEEGGGAADRGCPGATMANKSAAELLRARLKGLPPPQSPAAAAGVAAAVDVNRSAPMKAELVDDGGNAEPSERLGKAYDGGGDGGGGGRGRRDVVQLPLVDSRGRAVRGAFGREAAGAGTDDNAGRRAGTKPPQRYNRQTGEKERYFRDDDKVDLQTMLRRAKYGDDDMDMDEHLATNIANKRKFRGTDLDADAEYDYDGGLELYESRTKRGNKEAQRSRERNQQVTAFGKQMAAEAGCLMCFSNPTRPKHLTISLGTCTFLFLPARGCLVRGHCCIAPAEHLPSIRGLDEVTWTEVKNFIKCLIKMYGAQGQSVLFMETYMTRSGGRHHAVLDAVPVSERQLEKARGYFKKAILEAESEWSTHHAKACIETNLQKGLRESIPPNFPYFYVQFGYGSGYVHVIDDETKFDPNFGRQVLIGLLDLPPEMAYQRHKVESVTTQKQWVREFESQWDLYDWTRQLHDGA